MRVKLHSDGFEFSVGETETVLDAARRAGVELPHACRGGRCGLCAARCLSGEVRYAEGLPPAAELRAIEPGEILLCRAQALTDLTLDIRPVHTAGAGGPTQLPARVSEIERLGPDLAKVWLKLPRAEPFPFRAGQYLSIVLDDGVRRSYSIASPPHDRDRIELHLRRGTPGGRGAALFDALEPRALLTIEGPLGDFAYGEPATRDRQLILVAGGTGFAPVKSILRHVLDVDPGRPLDLYWGVRRRADLYDDGWLRAMVASHPNLRYVPVVSEEPGGLDDAALADGLRAGFVDAALIADHADLAGHAVYAAGPPAMLGPLRTALIGHGLPAGQFHSDLPAS